MLLSHAVKLVSLSLSRVQIEREGFHTNTRGRAERRRGEREPNEPARGAALT
jgi:hypothetical protein